MILNPIALKAKLDDIVKTNGSKLITAILLNNVLTDYIDSYPNIVTTALKLMEYDPAKQYKQTEGVLFEGKLFQANEDTQGVFNPAKWTEITGNYILKAGDEGIGNLRFNSGTKLSSDITDLKLSDPTSGGVIEDESGNESHGIAGGDVLPTFINSPFGTGKALSFDGDGLHTSYVNFGNKFALNSNGLTFDFSIVAADITVSNGYFMLKGVNGSEYNFRQLGGRLYFVAGGQQVLSSLLTQGNPYRGRVVVHPASNTMGFYIEGIRVGINGGISGLGTPGTGDFVLGSNVNQLLNGSLKYVRIFEYAAFDPNTTESYSLDPVPYDLTGSPAGSYTLDKFLGKASINNYLSYSKDYQLLGNLDHVHLAFLNRAIAKAGEGYESTIAGGTALQYWRGDKTFQTLDTGAVPENGRLYFTNARTIAAPLTGFAEDNSTITAADSILTGFDKAQGQISYIRDNYIPLSQRATANGVASLDSGGKVPSAQLPNTVMEYQGSWNASTNTPTLVDGTGNTGDVYRASVAGTQNLGSGNQTWAAGDLIIYNGSIWQHSPAADGVSSVFGRTGAVTAQNGDYSTDQVTEAGNLYFTNARARAAISGTANRISYNSGTGVFDIDSSYAGQNSITILGTVGTGVWRGSTLEVGFGGSGTSTQFTQGSLIFAGASGVYSQDNANLFWDASNHRLGIGTITPLNSIHATTVSGTNGATIGGIAAVVQNTNNTVGNYSGLMGINSNGNNLGAYQFVAESQTAATGSLRMGVFNAGTYVEVIRAISSGKVGIGTITPTALLHIGDDITGISSRKNITIVDSAGAGGVHIATDINNRAYLQFGTFGIADGYRLGGVVGNVAALEFRGYAANTGIYNANTAKLIVDYTTGFTGVISTAPKAELHVSSSATGAVRGIISAQYNTGTNGSQIILRKSRGTEAAPTILVSSDNICNVIAEGYDGAAYLQMGSMKFNAVGTIAANRVPTQWTLSTATDASPSVLTVSLTVDQQQRLGIGRAPQANVDSSVSMNTALVGFLTENVNSGANADARVVLGNGTNQAGLIIYGTGTATPSIMNIFNTGAFPITFSTNGVERARIDSVGNIQIAEGGNFILGIANGTKIGTATSQKIGFWNATAIVQPSGANQAALTNNTAGTGGTTLDAMSNVGAPALLTAAASANDVNTALGHIRDNFTRVYNLLDAMRTAMVSPGLMKGSA